MSRRISWMIIVAICISLFPIRMSSAQDGAWSEAFDDPALPGWEHSPGASVVDGVLRIEPGNFAGHGGDWADFTLSVSLRLTGPGSLAVIYHAGESGSHILLLKDNGIELHRESGGQVVLLNVAPLPVSQGAWHQIQLNASGDTHTVMLDGVQVLSVSDPDSPVRTGRISFEAVGEAAIEVDNLTVTLGAAVPQPAPQTPPTPAPAGEPGVWVRTGGPPGGLGYDIRMQPDNPDIMYVTDAHAGVHKSIDGGRTWFPANSGINMLEEAGTVPVFTLTIDPHNYNVLWVGTQLLAHIYRSTDAGQTWEAQDNGIVPDGRSVRGITVDPNDANILYAGVEVASIAWNGAPLVGGFDLTQGEVYKSTDAGQSWVRIWTGNNLARYIWVDPRNSNRLYVSTGIFDRDAADSNAAEGIGGGVGILRSDDGGQTWTVLNEAQGLRGRYVPSLFMHPQQPDVLIAGTTYLSAEHGVWVTRDGGDSWEKVLNSDLGVDAVEIATSNPNIWYAAGESTIWRSDDAGQTWQVFRTGTPDREAGVPIDLQVDPRDPYRIFVNNYNGGNFLSEDGGATWADASHGYTGLKVMSDVRVAPDDPDLVFADAFRSTDGGQTWVGTDAHPGDSFAFYPLPDSSGYGVIATSTNARIFHSTDHGVTWQAGSIVNLMDEMAAGRLEGDRLATISLVLAPSDPSRGYVGFTVVGCDTGTAQHCATPAFYRSNDTGYTWEAVEAPFNSVLSIAVHPDNPDRLFVGTVNGLYRSDDGAQSWQEVPGITIDFSQLTDPDLAYSLPQAIVYHVLFDPFDSNMLYAAVVPGAVWRSEDGGQTWQQTAAGMDPNEPIYEIAADPNRPGVLYASSGFSGVFYTIDGAQTWLRVSEGLDFTNVRGLGLSADGLALYAGTVGGGVYRLDTSPFVNP
jgi:photosystem II stability/assembly factor-like uncharacterized protein